MPPSRSANTGKPVEFAWRTWPSVPAAVTPSGPAVLPYKIPLAVTVVRPVPPEPTARADDRDKLLAVILTLTVELAVIVTARLLDTNAPDIRKAFKSATTNVGSAVLTVSCASRS